MNEKRDKTGRTEAEVIADYRSDKYQRPSLTADILVFSECEDELRLLMIKRGGHPFLDCWALPGGFANQGETIEQTAARELEEETGITGLDLRLTGIYSAPGRDPRGWTVSAAYAVFLPDGTIDAEARDDASAAEWICVHVRDNAVTLDLPDGGEPAFDHLQIITEAISQLGLA